MRGNKPTGVTLSSNPEEEKREVLNYKDLWNVKSLKKLDFWFLKPGKEKVVLLFWTFIIIEKEHEELKLIKYF